MNHVKTDVESNDGEFTNFSLILMDFRMPIMDGNEATSSIRQYLFEKGIKQPIISGCTGHVEQSYMKRMIENGMNSWIRE